MKTTKTLMTFLAMLGAGSLAFAQEGTDKPGQEGGPEAKPPQEAERGPRGGGRGPRATPEQIKKFDKDGDGKLNEEEIKALMEERRARREAHQKAMLEKYDADKDGKLSPEENKTARETEEKRILEKYDADKDGKLSPEERRAAMEAGEFFGGFGGPGGRRGGPRGGGDAPAPSGAAEKN